MWCIPLLLAGVVTSTTIEVDNVFPGKSWEQRSPESLGMNANLLDQLAEHLGGRGCVIKNGYIVKTWGDQTQIGDWASSAKPVLSTLLFLALQEGLIKSVDQPIADFGWKLQKKDQGITFRHLGSMSSGYARPEGPGEAWAYNDYAIHLYQMTLFDKVFKEDARNVAEHSNRLGVLKFQDGLTFSKKRRLSTSVRDFSRIVWLWLNKGRWGDKQLLPAEYFNEYMKPQTPKDLPQTRKADTEDYLEIGSYGGDSDHFSDDGPGTYGFNWWFNDTGRTHPDRLTWPSAPPDTIMSIGARGNSSAFIPSMNAALICADGSWNNENTDETLRLFSLACRSDQPKVQIKGDRVKWQPIKLLFEGPMTAERAEPNPFMNYRLTVRFTRDGRTVDVPGYYAADGNAAETGANSGSIWSVNFTPDEEGIWNYETEFVTGMKIAISEKTTTGVPVSFDGASGCFEVKPIDSSAPGFYSKGMLRAQGHRYLQFAETGEYFLKGGTDSPENLLAYSDFDGTKPTHKYGPHAADWRQGDPQWQNGKGKNLVGALNYLASKGMNSVYFLTMNVGGDGKDVWPWIDTDEKSRFDCSKLDQWDIIFTHMDKLGLLMHVVTQEQENDQLLDDGNLGDERKLYYRELVARFAHHPAVVWNLGEENTNTDEQRKSFAAYIRMLDPYRHPIVVHTFPSQYNKVYDPLLGFPHFDGPSLQMGDMRKTHEETLKWVILSGKAGKQWFVCQDEIGPPSVGVKPDNEDPDHSDVLRHALWGNLMAGGAGAEWFFQSDLHTEDWRTRDRLWEKTFFALNFFQKHLPFAEMQPRDDLVAGEGSWCLANAGEIYAIYTSSPDNCQMLLGEGNYRVDWYNPVNGGDLIPGGSIVGGGERTFGHPPHNRSETWVILLRKLRAGQMENEKGIVDLSTEYPDLNVHPEKP